MRFAFDPGKDRRLRRNPKRGIGFEEAIEIFEHPYYQDQRSDDPEQYRAIGWVGGKLFSLIFEVREDDEGELYHLVTLWKSTREEENLYAKTQSKNR
ncbi:MAG: BrnT family toxin [Deltaproteobacteria bacterium]|nr:BrnT family toxin [Deltaproteobacteria bacterium]